jgi:hypothetical protein
MKKKIQVIVICSGIAEELKAVTANSINKLNEIGKKENVFYYNEPIIIEALDRKEEAVKLNQYLARDRKPGQDCDYYFIITNGSEVPKNLEELLVPYMDSEHENNTIYLPLVELGWYINEGDKEISSKGFLNSCVWKSYIAEEVGVLDEKLARRQIDTVMYGCLLPSVLFQEHKFNEELKFFYQFDFFNKITNLGVKVIGIPKCSLFLSYDYELKAANVEEKREEFKLVQQPTPINV